MKLQVGITGSVAPETGHLANPYTYLRRDAVVELLTGLAVDGPARAQELVRRYPEAAADLERLIEMTILRHGEDGRVHLNFTFFSAEDQKLVLSRLESPVVALVDRLLEHREQLERRLAAHGYPHVGRDQLAFMLIGCYFLDLRCLSLLPAHGFMGRPRVMPGDNRHFIWALEPAPSISLRGVYWGCHSHTVGAHVLNTFGDHAPETSRSGFPDLAWNLRESAQGPTLRLVLGERMDGLMADVAGVLEAIPPDGLQRGALDEVSPNLVDLLVEMGYLTESGGRLHLGVPFFTERCTQAFTELLSLLDPVVLEWTSGQWSRLQRDLGELTPLRHGVPFEEVFCHLWHFIFGLANREMARRGFITDTYLDDWRHPGYMMGGYPADWHEILRENGRGGAS